MIKERNLTAEIVCLCVALSAAPLLSAQNTSDTTSEKDEFLTVEDVFLQPSLVMGIIKAQLESGDTDLQLLALEALEDKVQEGGKESEKDNVFSMLTPIVEQGVMNIPYNTRYKIESYNPIVRHKAVGVLGMLNTEEAKDQLILTVKHDPDPAIRAQALYGLGAIGSDPTGEVTHEIARMLLRDTLKQPPRFSSVYAGILAIEEISKNPENRISKAAVKVLVDIASNGRCGQLLRDNALRVLSNL